MVQHPERREDCFISLSFNVIKSHLYLSKFQPKRDIIEKLYNLAKEERELSTCLFTGVNRCMYTFIRMLGNLKKEAETLGFSGQ